MYAHQQRFLMCLVFVFHNCLDPLIQFLIVILFFHSFFRVLVRNSLLFVHVTFNLVFFSWTAQLYTVHYLDNPL